MSSNLGRFVILLVVGVLALAVTPASDAALTMRLISGANDITIVDGGADDLSGSGDGVVIWIGAVGTWSLNVSTGVVMTTDPGSMDLNSVVASSGAGDLTIMLSDNGFTGSTTGMTADIGGTLAAGGSLTASAYFNDSNAVLDIANAEESISLGEFNKYGGFSGSKSQSGSVSAPFSMTLVTVLHHSKVGLTSYDFQVNAVPEPGTFALWSLLSFPGLGAYLLSRRLKREQR